MFAENGHVKELVTAFFGNYTLQELLDATHKLRQAAAKLRALNSASKEDIDRMLGFADGQDALGAITGPPSSSTSQLKASFLHTVIYTSSCITLSALHGFFCLWFGALVASVNDQPYQKM